MIPLMVDVVSKNGNLLLSIPLPGYGEPDTDEIDFWLTLRIGKRSIPKRLRARALEDLWRGSVHRD